MFSIILSLLVLWVFYGILRFITTPLLRKLGVYRYYSLFMFLFKRSSKTYEIHLGTSWDHMKNPVPLFKIHLHVLDGLMALCDDVASNRIPAFIMIRGCVHYLNESSLTKIGFRSRKQNIIDRMFFMTSYPEVLLVKWLVTGRFTLISPFNARIVTCPAGELLANKTILEKYRKMLAMRYQKKETKEDYLNVA